MDSDTMDAAYHDSRFTAEISKRMQVPDRIAIGGQEIGAGDSQNGVNNIGKGVLNNSEPTASLKMQVPERILVAGGNSHVAAKNLPRELQLENSVLSPSPEQILAPPNSIRLNEHPFPTVGQESGVKNVSTNEKNVESDEVIIKNGNPCTIKKDSDSPMTEHDENTLQSNSQIVNNNKQEFSKISLLEESLSTYQSERDDELREARRQIAKLNRRMMELELENRDLQQRELLIGIIVFGYIFKKALQWS